MLTIPTLTTRQLDDFRRDGFVFVKGCFTADDMMQIQVWTSEFAANTGSIMKTAYRSLISG